jgi:hypothetical protein
LGGGLGATGAWKSWGDRHPPCDRPKNGFLLHDGISVKRTFALALLSCWGFLLDAYGFADIFNAEN